MVAKLISIRLFYIKLTELKIPDLELICRVFIGDYSNVLNNKKSFFFALVSDFVHVSIDRYIDRLYRLKYRLLHLASHWLF